MGAAGTGGAIGGRVAAAAAVSFFIRCAELFENECFRMSCAYRVWPSALDGAASCVVGVDCTAGGR